MIDRPEHADPPPDSRAQDSRAEQVLSQALRAMVGGDKPDTGPAGGENPGGTRASGDPTRTRFGRRLTTGQLLLLAAIVGLVVGIAAGLLSLLF